MIGAGLLFLLAFARAYAQTDPLPSWNDGPAKQAIVDFVKATTEQNNPKFVPPEVDCYLRPGWHDLGRASMYTHVIYCLERVRRWSRPRRI